jgi:hypothetical protein
MAITVLQVIDAAIGLAQLDQSFRPQGRLYYNLAIREQNRDFDWPYYNKLSDPENFIAGQTEYDLPDDYSRSDTVYLYANGQRGRQIKMLDKTLFDQLRVPDPATSGSPRICTVDRNAGKLVFECVPGQDGFIHRYFRKASEIDVNGSNDADVPDFDDETFLIQKIAQWFFDYTDDDRYTRKVSEVDKKLREAKLNVYNIDDNSVVDLNNSVHIPGRRPTRGGGGGSSGSLF